MSQNETTTTTETKATVKGVKTAPKKSVKGAAPKATEAKKTTKAPAKKTAPKAETTPRDPSDLTPSRIKCLQFLNTVEYATGSEIAASCEMDPSQIGNVIGYRKPEINEREVHAGNLINLKLVTLETAEGTRGYVYKITKLGTKKVESIANGK